MSNQTCDHVDAAKLEDLEYRFNYVCKFIGFGEAEIKTIKGAADAVAPLVPSIVDAVYTKLFSFDITKEYFLVRGENFNGEIPTSIDALNQEHAQIKHRKDMLSKYLVKLVTAEYDINTVKYLDYVAKIHTNKSGNKNLVVDYVHINALLAYVEDIILNAIMGLEVPNEAKTKLVRAFNKLLWLQNDLFARHYVPAKPAKEEQK